MERLTIRNSEGIEVLKQPYQCERCGDLQWSLPDLGNGSPTERLAEYEDLEEQGKLIRVPCKIGDTIYVIPSEVNYRLNILSGHEENNRVHEQVVNRIEIGRYGYSLSTCDGMASVVEESYKATWFLTKEEAETALKGLEGGKGK